MSAFVQSARRLFVKGSIDEKKLQEWLNDGKIDDKSYHYIKTGEL